MTPQEYNVAVAGKIWSVSALPWTPLPGTSFKRLFSCNDLDGFVDLVKKFQLYHGLEVDGMLGPNTWAIMERSIHPVNRYVKGVWMWVWLLSQIGKLETAVERMSEAGIRGIFLKVADGMSPTETNTAHLKKVVKVFQSVGMGVVPWAFGWCYDRDSKLAREVTTHRQLIEACGASAFVLNAEKGFVSEWKHSNGIFVSQPNYLKHAELYVNEMRKSGVLLYLSSYGNPSAHPNFPWEQFGQMDILMPQSYWGVMSSPTSKKKRARPEEVMDCAAEYYRNHCKSSALIMPSGGCYQRKVDGKWDVRAHTAPDIDLFFNHVRALCLPGSAVWAYFSAQVQGKARMSEAQWAAVTRNAHSMESADPR